MMNKIRRANKRDFFIAQNMIFDLDISEHAKITYLYLCRCADDESQAFPSYNTIAKKCSFSRRTAIDVIKELQAIGLLSVEKRQVEKGGKPVNTSNLYTLYDSPSHDPSAGDALPLVQDVHHPSAGDALPLVQEMHHPSAGDAPYKYSIKNTNSIINTQSINQSINQGDRIDEIGISDNQKNKKSLSTPSKEKATSEKSDIDTYKVYRDIIADNIEYGYLKERYPYESMVDDILELMTEVVTSNKATIRVSGEDKPQDIVKSTFLKLTSSHIEYVMECMSKNTVKANNIKAYMITVLYNAPKTINAYYSNLVNHDMAHHIG